jgi:hypothetical protein
VPEAPIDILNLFGAFIYRLVPLFIFAVKTMTAISTVCDMVLASGNWRVVDQLHGRL